MKRSPDKFNQMTSLYTHFEEDWLVDKALESIKWTIESIRGTELCIAQTLWLPHLEGINDILC
jgi:hypothetical protein